MHEPMNPAPPVTIIITLMSKSVVLFVKKYSTTPRIGELFFLNLIFPVQVYS